jgi:putative heme uptake system protein
LTAIDAAGTGRITYLLVDGENLDATLGTDILRHRPAPDERPRWDRVTDFLRQAWGQEVRGLFFLNASAGTLPMPFVQALLALGYRVIPLSGGRDEKVVDIGIQRTLAALLPREADVALVSHDADFEESLRPLLRDRRVALLGFREYVSQRLAELEPLGLQFFDMELAVGAFNIPLPRVRIITLDEFDPERFLA